MACCATADAWRELGCLPLYELESKLLKGIYRGLYRDYYKGLLGGIPGV